MHGHNVSPIKSQPPIGSRPLRVKWSRDQWRHMTPKGQGHDPIIFKVAIKLANTAHLIYTDFTVSYQDTLDRLHVCLNSILFSYFIYCFIIYCACV